MNEMKVNPTEERRVKHAGTSCWQGPEYPEHSTRGEVWTLGAIIMSLCNQYRNVGDAQMITTLSGLIM